MLLLLLLVVVLYCMVFFAVGVIALGGLDVGCCWLLLIGVGCC